MIGHTGLDQRPEPRGGASAGDDEVGFDLVGKLNQLRAAEYPDDPALAARVKAYELAFRMQKSLPEVLDFKTEPAAVQAIYGLDKPETRPFGLQLLASRRLVERGVRFIQIQHGAGGAGTWDAHGGLKANHSKNCLQVDKPIAGLLTDLKARGLLKDTLVLWGGEFGRTPIAQGKDGRDHDPQGFTMWLAGGGTRGGYVHGATDEFGYHAVDGKVHMHDLHATLLHLLGLDHEKLTYRYAGRDFRLTDVYGHVVKELFA